MSNGFITVRRQIEDWQWWHNPTARSLWFYILISANWADGYNRDGTLIKRGSFARSLRNMSEETGYTVKTIRYWLKKFEKTGEISVNRAQGYTVINVINYAKYQDIPSDKGTPSITPSNTPSITPSITDITRKQENKKNNIYNRRFTPPTLEEVKAYCAERKNKVDAERFLDYYTANGWVQGRAGKPVKDWKACIRTWERSNFATPKRAEVLPEYYGTQETETATDAQREEARKLLERLKND